MKKQRDYSPAQAITYLNKVLDIKPANISIDINMCRVTVNRVNTLIRLEKIIQQDIFVNKYNNSDAKVQTSDNHYWIDFWVKGTLITYSI